MGLLVLAYPNLLPEDFEWIEAIRLRHNPQDAAIVGPHITLLFETDVLSPSELVAHVRPLVEATPAIDLVFRSAMVMPGIVAAESYLFLVPDEGFGAVARLHDRLYSGPLRPERRLDIPHVPHMTLGRFGSAEACRDAAAELMSQSIEIRAQVEMVDIVEYDGRSITTIERLGLSGG